MTKEARELADECGGYWAEHHEYLIEDWGHAIQNNDTRLGYWDWILEMLKNEDDNDF